MRSKLTRPERQWLRGVANSWRQRRRAQAIVVLGGKCVGCGCKSRLEFDHIDPAKKALPSNRLLTAAADKFWGEIAKCQLLCHRCHTRKIRREGEHAFRREHTLAYA